MHVCTLINIDILIGMYMVVLHVYCDFDYEHVRICFIFI